MRTQAFLRPPPPFLPPPFDARVLRVALTRAPRVTQVTVMLHAPAVVHLVMRAVKAVTRWVRAVVHVPDGRRGNTVRARGPPD